MQPVARSSTALSRASGLSYQQYVCPTCIRSAKRRRYASGAAAQAVQETAPPQQPPESRSSVASSPRPTYQLRTGVALSRPPQITRELHPFETAFYFYQKRLNERLALPFMRYFYYKKGTPSDLVWKRKMKERLTPARDIGKYRAYGKEAWNDELLVGDKLSDQQNQLDSLSQDAEVLSIAASPEVSDAAGVEQAASKEVPLEKGAERVTEADRVGDLTSLNRLLQRTLFLLVKDDKGRWTFPTSKLQRGEALDQAAERCLVQAAGSNMNTWVIGHNPVGHYATHLPAPVQDAERDTVELGQKDFFMKGRIMAGQANLADNKLGLTEFRWLAREEIQKLVTPRYWSMTEAMLGER
ncbi:MAG: 54S ribosomal protein L17 mitochondrial [Chrysothrix sp. TS-e1954]|nr:MAG: 54S ribosomal protein L17 mitochondrial [Chrysothrix sp. TS-e1954]